MAVNVNNILRLELFAQGGLAFVRPNIIVEMAIWEAGKWSREPNIGVLVSKLTRREMVKVLVRFLVGSLGHNPNFFVTHDGSVGHQDESLPMHLFPILGCVCSSR